MFQSSNPIGKGHVIMLKSSNPIGKGHVILEKIPIASS